MTKVAKNHQSAGHQQIWPNLELSIFSSAAGKALVGVDQPVYLGISSRWLAWLAHWLATFGQSHQLWPELSRRLVSAGKGPSPSFKRPEALPLGAGGELRRGFPAVVSGWCHFLEPVSTSGYQGRVPGWARSGYQPVRGGGAVHSGGGENESHNEEEKTKTWWRGQSDATTRPAVEVLWENTNIKSLSLRLVSNISLELCSISICNIKQIVWFLICQGLSFSSVQKIS